MHEHDSKGVTVIRFSAIIIKKWPLDIDLLIVAEYVSRW